MLCGEEERTPHIFAVGQVTLHTALDRTCINAPRAFEAPFSLEISHHDFRKTTKIRGAPLLRPPILM